MYIRQRYSLLVITKVWEVLFEATSRGPIRRLVYSYTCEPTNSTNNTKLTLFRLLNVLQSFISELVTMSRVQCTVNHIKTAQNVCNHSVTEIILFYPITDTLQSPKMVELPPSIKVNQK